MHGAALSFDVCAESSNELVKERSMYGGWSGSAWSQNRTDLLREGRTTCTGQVAPFTTATLIQTC